MTDQSLCYLGAAEAIRMFKAGSLSPVELVQAHLDRIEETNGTVNAVCFTYGDEALDKAKEAEARYASGDALPLDGLPTAFKDENMIEGKVTTYGSLIYKDHVATSTTPVVERLLAAGAIPHARTTTPEFSCEGFTHSKLWGVTRNPWNTDYTPGGSSGGSGAALASGMAALATGSDIGGSIRIPASASGVVGFKPPYGRNPGSPPFSMDFYNHAGPMARTVEDCMIMQNIMCGPHPHDIATVRPKLEMVPDRSGIKGMKIAWSMDLSFYEVDTDVQRNTLAALDILRGLGAEVVEVDLGWTKATEEAADNYLATLFGAWISDYLGEHADKLTKYALTFGEQSQGVTNKQFLASLNVAGAMYDSFGPLMETYDAFICPTTALPAVPADFDPSEGLEINGKPVHPRHGWIMTYPFNMLSRCPVLSVPTGHASNGVPTGMQIVGRTFCDADVFKVGMAFEEAVGGWYASADTRPVLTA